MACMSAAAGWGRVVATPQPDGCTTQCGGTVDPIKRVATYGPPGRKTDLTQSACVDCPRPKLGYELEVPSSFSPTKLITFMPDVVARAQAQSIFDCLLEFSPIGDQAWDFGSSDSILTTVGPSVGLPLEECVQACKISPKCQYLQWAPHATKNGTCQLKLESFGTESADTSG